MTTPLSASDILKNLIATGQITATGIRQFTLGTTTQVGGINTVGGGSVPDGAGGGSIPGGVGGSVPDGAGDGSIPVPENLLSYDELLAAELAEAGISLDVEDPLDTSDPTIGLTAADAAALGLSPDDFASLSQNTNVATATTASVNNQGDKGKGIPPVPTLSFPNVLGMAGAGASTLTLAGKAALISSITSYVTDYVASQIAPLQMQVTAVAAAVPAGAGSIASIPGKIMSVISKIKSIVAKVKTIVTKVKSISKTIPTIKKQIIDKTREAKAKAAEKAKQSKDKTVASANREREKSGDNVARSRKTITTRQDKSNLRTKTTATPAKRSAQARTNKAIQNSVQPRAVAPIQQTQREMYNPITGETTFENFTEVIGPIPPPASTRGPTGPAAPSTIPGLEFIGSPTAPNFPQRLAQARAIEMYNRDINSLSLAITLYTTEGGGTRTEFLEDVGLNTPSP